MEACETIMKRPAIEPEVLDQALAAFARAIGPHAQLVPKRAGNAAEPLVEVKGPNGTTRYAPVVRTKVDRATVALGALHATRARKTSPLLVAPLVSTEIAGVCRNNNLPFMDCAGNAFLSGPNTFVFVVGHKPSKSALLTQRKQRSFGESGLRIVFNCLADPSLFQAALREIARASGTALGTVSGIMADLRTQNFLAEDKKGRRHWVSKDRIVQAWMVNYPLALRPKLGPRRFRARSDDWWKAVAPLTFGMQWGGEVAAAKLTSELEPRTVTLFAHQPIARFVGAHRFTAADDGPVEILDAFWPIPGQGTKAAEIVSPLLICADLLSMADPRTIQVARTIQEKHLA
jgi:hypothetical protein